jgi:superoxide dismutase, Fe-Mn family
MLALPELEYDVIALEPYISAGTLALHHGKHHRAYVEKTNSLTGEIGAGQDTLEQIIALGLKAGNTALFNNAAQAWNHAFYWKSMTPKGGGPPHGEIARRIDDRFGGFSAFAEQFSSAAMGQFGSGWAWLVLEGDELVITQTANADTPIAHRQAPLLTLDVWEHAYYLDHQNRRADYVAAYLAHLVDWEFANRNLVRAADCQDVFRLFEDAAAPKQAVERGAVMRG